MTQVVFSPFQLVCKVVLLQKSSQLLLHHRVKLHGNASSHFRVSLVSLISTLFRVCVIPGDTDEIDLQLERTVGFIPQSKSNRVDLENRKGYEVNQTCRIECQCVTSLLHLVQPERMLTILHPPATWEEELGEWYLKQKGNGWGATVGVCWFFLNSLS